MSDVELYCLDNLLKLKSECVLMKTHTFNGVTPNVMPIGVGPTIKLSNMTFLINTQYYGGSNSY